MKFVAMMGKHIALESALDNREKHLQIVTYYRCASTALACISTTVAAAVKAAVCA